MTGIFITARMGSTRLKKKHLIEAEGIPFINWLVNRFLAEFSWEIDKDEVKIFITTSVNSENKEFESIIDKQIVSIFYGSDKNIPFRHLQCAKHNNITNIISVDGDDILCSTTAARIIMERLKRGRSIVQTEGLPLGMNIMGYSRSFLEESLQNKHLLNLETGWGKIFDSTEIDTVRFNDYLHVDTIRMTLDYEEDSKFFKTIIKDLGDEVLNITDRTLIDIIKDKDWTQLNSHLNDEYWLNFNKQKKEEN